MAACDPIAHKQTSNLKCQDLTPNVISKFATVILLLANVIVENSCSKKIFDHRQSAEIFGKYYPGYNLMAINDLDPLPRKYFKTTYSINSPSYISGDFDGNGLNDFALLLKSKDIKDEKLIFVILTQDTEGELHNQVKVDLGKNHGSVFIIPRKPGEMIVQTLAVDAPDKRVKLKYTSIEVVYLGKASVVYYWDVEGKSIDTIQTTD